ncbi:MAG: hypothetical protein Tsb002_08600 [Wenzhouxiangellaceae bacterium]
MPTTYTLGEKWEEFLAQKVKSGDFNNKSEVIRAGLRMLEEQDLRTELRRRIARMDAGEYETLETFNDKIGQFLTEQERAVHGDRGQ